MLATLHLTSSDSSCASSFNTSIDVFLLKAISALVYTDISLRYFKTKFAGTSLFLTTISLVISFCASFSNSSTGVLILLATPALISFDSSFANFSNTSIGVCGLRATHSFINFDSSSANFSNTSTGVYELRATLALTYFDSSCARNLNVLLSFATLAISFRDSSHNSLYTLSLNVSIYLF